MLSADKYRSNRFLVVLAEEVYPVLRGSMLPSTLPAIEVVDEERDKPEDHWPSVCVRPRSVSWTPDRQSDADQSPLVVTMPVSWATVLSICLHHMDGTFTTRCARDAVD